MWYFEVWRKRRSKRWKDHFPPLGSASGREGGCCRIFYTVVLCLMSNKSSCISMYVLAWVGTVNKVFFADLLHTSSCHHRQAGRRQSSEVQFYGPSLILYSPATCGVSTSRPCVQSASHEPTKQSSAVVNMLGNIVFHRLWGLFNAYGRSFQYMIQKKTGQKRRKGGGFGSMTCPL